jgi:hypothetical protein
MSDLLKLKKALLLAHINADKCHAESMFRAEAEYLNLAKTIHDKILELEKAGE